MSTLRDLYVGNVTCAECGATSPRWASINLGILICMDCSGHHRQMGTHISKVKSCTLDNWQNEWIKTVATIGNDLNNRYFEHNMPQELKIGGSRSTTKVMYNAASVRDKVFNKYIHRKWIPKGYPQGPAEIFLQGGDPLTCLPEVSSAQSSAPTSTVPTPAQVPKRNPTPPSNPSRPVYGDGLLGGGITEVQVEGGKVMNAMESVQKALEEPELIGLSQPTYPGVRPQDKVFRDVDDLLEDLQDPQHAFQQQRSHPPTSVPLVDTNAANKVSAPPNRDPFRSLLD